jgi:hypothetical protein
MSSIPDNFDTRKLSDRNYKGEDFNINPEIIKDPFNKRRCTDCFMAIFFCLFLSAIVFIASLGYTKGDPA